MLGEYDSEKIMIHPSPLKCVWVYGSIQIHGSVDENMCRPLMHCTKCDASSLLYCLRYRPFL